MYPRKVKEMGCYILESDQLGHRWFGGSELNIICPSQNVLLCLYCALIVCYSIIEFLLRILEWLVHKMICLNILLKSMWNLYDLEINFIMVFL